MRKITKSRENRLWMKLKLREEIQLIMGIIENKFNEEIELRYKQN